MRKFCIGLALSIVLCSPAFARVVTLPHAEPIESAAAISDVLRFGAAGATVTFVPGSGWNGGGAVKITPPTNFEGYGGLGNFDGFSSAKLNLRFLIKIGSNFAGVAQMDKLVIMNRASGIPARRAMIFDSMRAVDQNGGAAAMVYSPCLGTLCRSPIMGNWTHHPFYVTSTKNVDEWFVFEYEADLPNKRLNLYIWSRDGRYTGLYASYDMAVGLDNEGAFNSQSDPVINVEGIGWYWHSPEERAPLSARNANTYIMVDDIVIATSSVGPPVGFVTSVPVPPPAVYVVSPNPASTTGTRPLYPSLVAAQKRTTESGRIAVGTVCEAATLAAGSNLRWATNACGTRGVTVCGKQ